MAAARKTNPTTRATSEPKAEDTTASVKGDSTPVGATKESEELKSAELAAAEAKVDDLKDDQSGGVVPADQLETKVVRNPELDGGVDKVADARAEDEKRAEESGVNEETEKREEQRERFLTEGLPTSEAWDDPHVNLADLPANFDPVVSADHATASHAAEVDNGKLIASTAVQISQFDNSTFGTNVLNSLSHTAEAVVKDDAKDDDKK